MPSPGELNRIVRGLADQLGADKRAPIHDPQTNAYGGIAFLRGGERVGTLSPSDIQALEGGIELESGVEKTISDTHHE